MQKRRQSGFTLLEVMVVIVILGILASLVVPNLMGNKEKADQQKAVSDIVALENALDMYKLDNNRYPTTEQGLDALVNKPTASPEPRSYREGGYIKRPGQFGKLDIFSMGLDGEAGTDDDIGNWNLKDFQ